MVLELNPTKIVVEAEKLTVVSLENSNEFLLCDCDQVDFDPEARSVFLATSKGACSLIFSNNEDSDYTCLEFVTMLKKALMQKRGEKISTPLKKDFVETFIFTQTY